MKMKQTAALLMAAMLAFAGVGCGNSGGNESAGGSAGSESSGNETAGTEADGSDAGDADENGSSKGSGEPIQIATKPMTEQYILGEMLKLLIEENTDYTAEIGRASCRERVSS